MVLVPPGCCEVLASPPTIAGSAAFTACCVVAGSVPSCWLICWISCGPRCSWTRSRVEAMSHLSWRSASLRVTREVAGDLPEVVHERLLRLSTKLARGPEYGARMERGESCFGQRGP